VLVEHDPHAYTTDTASPYAIEASMHSLGAGGLVAGSTELVYRIDGGSFETVVLEPTGAPDTYAGSIPPLPWGSRIEYYLTAMNDTGESGSSPPGAPTECHVFRVDDGFVDDLELDGSWTVGATGDDATTGIWVRADPVGTVYEGFVVQPEDDRTPDPGTDCFVTGNGEIGGAAGVNDVDGGRITLTSPVYDLTGGSDVQIGYWRWYTNDRGYNPGEDLWRVDISNDGGATWVEVENGPMSSNAWVEAFFDLDVFFPAPGLVRLRFIAEDEGGGSLVEAAVDDLTILGDFGGTTAAGGETTAAHGPQHLLRLDPNRPNPFNPSTLIPFRLERDAIVRLAIYDTAGRMVRILHDGALVAGDHRVRWNGQNAAGRVVPSGVYRCLLTDGVARSMRALTVVR
jgi:hypothetical protein